MNTMKKIVVSLLAVCTLSCFLFIGIITVLALEGYTAKVSNEDVIMNISKNEIYEDNSSGTQSWWGGTNNQKFCNKTASLIFKAEYSGSIENAAFSVITGLKKAANSAISVSVDGNEWTLIGDDTMPGIGADGIIEDSTITDRAYRRLVWKIGDYFEDGNIIYVKLHARNTDLGGGFEVVNSAIFHANYQDQGVEANVTEEAVVLDIEANQIWRDFTSGKNSFWGHTGNFRFCDNKTTAVFKATYTGNKQGAAFSVIAKPGINGKISYSTDGKNFTQIADDTIENFGADRLLNTYDSYIQDKSFKEYCWNIDDYFGDGDVIYIMLSARDTTQGNGLQFGGYATFYPGEGGEENPSPDGFVAEISDQEVILSLANGEIYEDRSTGSRDWWGVEKSQRFCDKEAYVIYKAIFSGDKSKAGFKVITNAVSAKNSAIFVSSDGKEWLKIGDNSMPLIGAVEETEPINGYVPQDQAFKSYVWDISEYFGAGDTIYVKLAANDITQGNGFVLAMYAAFTPNLQINDKSIYMESGMNSLDVNLTDSEIIYADLGSVVKENSLGFHRFADNKKSFTYKLVLPADASDVYMKVYILGENRAIWFSPDGNAFDLVSTSKNLGAEVVQSDNCTMFFKLDDYLGFEKNAKVVYVRFGANDTSKGNGADVYSLSFFNGAVRPEIEHEGKLFGENTISTKVSVLDDSVLYENQNSFSNSYLAQWGRAIQGNKDSNYFTYKVILPNDATTFAIAYNMQNSLLVYISTNGKDYSTIPTKYLLNTKYGDGSATTYNLTTYLSQSKTIYLRFIDGAPNDEVAAMLVSLYMSYNSASLVQEGTATGTESYSAFAAGDEKEQSHWINKSSQDNRFTGAYREFNYNAEGIYRFKYTEGATAVRVYAILSGSYVFSVSGNTTDWVQLKTSEQQFYDDNVFPANSCIDEFMIDVSKYMGEDGYIYFKIEDSVKDNAYGAQLRSLGIISVS